MYRTFDELLAGMHASGEKKRLAVVWAGEEHTLQAVLAAKKACGVEPVLIGDGQEIRRILKELGCNDAMEIVPAASPEEAIQTAIALVKSGSVQVIFKGLLQTATIMRAIVNKQTGICRDGILSHVSIAEIPGHHKLVAVTDAALLTYPTKEQKVQLIRNAVKTMQAIGVAQPKVAILAAVETVNPKMPETVEAAELKELGLAGEMGDCLVEGPISYDLAMDPDAAKVKGYESPVAGDADILVVPNIQAGNMLLKSLVVSAKAKTCGMIIGAQVPVIISSRSAPVINKSYAIAVASMLGSI